MVDFGVAIAWIFISAVSVVGLSACSRAATAGAADTELAALAFDGQHGCEDVYAIGAHPPLQAVAVGGLVGAAAGDVGAASF